MDNKKIVTANLRFQRKKLLKIIGHSWNHKDVSVFLHNSNGKIHIRTHLNIEVKSQGFKLICFF